MPKIKTTPKKIRALRMPAELDTFLESYAHTSGGTLTDVLTEALEEFRMRVEIETIMRDSIKRNQAKYETQRAFMEDFKKRGMYMAAGPGGFEQGEKEFIQSISAEFVREWRNRPPEQKDEKWREQFLKDRVRCLEYYCEPEKSLPLPFSEQETGMLPHTGGVLLHLNLEQ